MALIFGIFGVLLNVFIVLVESGDEHYSCPVGFPGTIKHTFSRKAIKPTDFLCKKDSDCPNGKCCGILGGNMCIYLHDKMTNEPRPKDLRSKLSKILKLSEWRNSQMNKTEDWDKERIEKALRSGSSYKCFDKTGRKLKRCSSGFRWSHFIFLLCSGGLCVIVGFAALMVYQKKKGTVKSETNRTMKKQNMASSDAERNPVYMVRVRKDVKVLLNLDGLVGNQTNQPSHVSDVTSVQPGRERERTASK